MKLQENVFNNERLTGLLSYLDRLQALSDVGHTCTREITECIKAIREELALTIPDGIALRDGETISLHIEGADDSLYITGPTKITLDARGDRGIAQVDDIASQIANRLAKESGDIR